jgi:hypothetical protein
VTATFDLTSAERDIRTADGFTTTLRADGMTKTPVTYLDFTVDRAPLLPQLATSAAGGLDFVGVIQQAWPIEAVAAIQRLLGAHEGDLPDGRISLYVCPECGDLGCGAVTAKLHVRAETVTWREIGWQADYDEEVSPLGDDAAFLDIAFTRASYEAALLPVLATMRPLADEFEYPYQRERRHRRDRLTGQLRRFFPHE